METGPTVCGYMGLDGASGSAPETQKLNFEEQPDSRVRLHERASDSCSQPCIFFAEEARLQTPQVPSKSQAAIREARGWVLT